MRVTDQTAVLYEHTVAAYSVYDPLGAVVIAIDALHRRYADRINGDLEITTEEIYGFYRVTISRTRLPATSR
jgi:predicted AlkP superfamily pyrophosphatase or phosphodiesterase